ncbi:response regulator [Pedobacter nyackensis]|uniref:cAMP-binding domain of CRP or a regulatory subunit of cAMP-dependent protein kinases n=1 Tax=Pedobacter nyackensis TaxID=475255 RepID=A0A1W2DBJ7_9SPHI|nr:response regulator [Pedobacter nyackensis]SMC94840.1 cAMP-binding domain of CRP or a regulatory subunit of cAMP-dependent protein kinases [Pedobacter nyackensis]
MKTVLIIEDNVDILESCAEILELSGYHVLQSDNGKHGIELAVENQPDLILCDIMMPEMDGYDVLKLLGQNNDTAEIPFVFLTAKTDRFDFRKGMEMGADDYLTKPFNDTDLLHAVETRIKKHQRQKAYYSSTFQNLEKLSLGNGNGMKELKALIADRKIRHIKKKQVLYYEGDTPQGLYLVVEGSIKTIKLAADGRQFITGLYNPDDYIGLDALLLDEDFTETAEAVEDTSLYLLPRELILNLVNKYPEVSNQFIKILSNNIHEKEEQLLELAYLSVRKRLAQVLLRLSKKASDSDLLNVTRDELAALAGIAIETVSRTLSDFKEEGLIEKNGTQIKLVNIERLMKMKN